MTDELATRSALEVQEFRERAMSVEQELASLDGALIGHDSEQVCPVSHLWGEGCYVREWSSPPDMIVVSKIHKVAHPYFIMRGTVSVLTEEGLVKIEAPHYGITPAGTKRILYTHTDVQWVTVHVTNSTDLAEIEEEIIAKDFDDPRLTAKAVEQMQEAIA